MLTNTYVKGDGPFDAPIWLVGGAPGREENKVGKPFIGSAGRLLDVIIRAAGGIRGEMHVTNCFRRRPPDNAISYYFTDSKNKYPTDEGLKYLEELRLELEEHRPNVVVALGGVAMQLLCGKVRITKWRGSVIPCTLVPGIKVYTSYHPSYVMRHMQEKGQKRDEKKSQNLLPIAIRDMERALLQSEFPEINTPQRNIIIPSGLGVIAEWLGALEPGLTVAVDIETRPSSRGPIITRIGLAANPKEALSIHLVWDGMQAWTARELAEILRLLSDFMLNPDYKKLFQGGMYDLTIMGKSLGLRCAEGTVEDTMVSHHATYPHLPKGLDFQASVYTWEPYYKDDGKVWGKRVGDNALSIYNGKDCCVTREIWPILYQDSVQLGTKDGYERSISYYPSLLAMALRGVRCDEELRGVLSDRFSKGADEASEKITEIMGREYKISTAYTKDLVQLLYVDMALAPQYKKGKLTTEDNALLKLKKLYPSNEVLDLVRTRRRLLKLVNTSLAMETINGRFHTSYNPAGTATWRLSSSESPLGGGGNLQNIPKRTEEGREVRKLFIPDEGKVLVAADYSQAEARVVAWLSQERIEIEAFNCGQDIHKLNAVDLGLGPDLESINTVERNIAKNMKHGYNYEVGPRRLQQELLRYGFDVPFAECKQRLATIRAKRPMIEHWKQQVKAKINTDRTLITPLGRKRVFYGRKGPDLLRKAIAFVPQSTVGELLCIAIRDIHRSLEAERGMLEILLNVHDEVVVQCPRGTEQAVREALRELMEIPLNINDMELVIPVDFKVGENWGEMEDF